VFARLLLFLLLVTAFAGAGNSQSSPDLGLPEPCRTKASEDLSALQKRKERLEREIARSGRQDDAGAKTLTKTQEDLLEVLFQIDCAKRRLETAAKEAMARDTAAQQRKGEATAKASPPPPPAAAPSAPGAEPTPRSFRKLKLSDTGDAEKGDQAIEVTTYFATNRAQTGRREPAADVYDAKPAALSYGRALVTIPPGHTSGNLELPSIWKLELSADPKRHFILKSATPLTLDATRAEMAKKLEGSASKALLIFVHGYNVSFAETAMRTAQLAYDLNFPGLPFFFSWPSAAQYTGYLRDAETAQLSEAAFDQLLDDLATLPVNDVYVIAHSMGSRIVSQALRSRIDRGKPAGVSELLLAAPDINADLFRTAIAPRLQALKGTKATVYASSSDLALMASKAVHGYARVGETASGVLVYPGVETIDASRVAIAARAFGHSYLTDSAAVLKDIGALLRQKLKAKQRGLPEAGVSPNVYWSLP
jgi:esterase/lipase superfamily enzyme